MKRLFWTAVALFIYFAVGASISLLTGELRAAESTIASVIVYLLAVASYELGHRNGYRQRCQEEKTTKQ